MNEDMIEFFFNSKKYTIIKFFIFLLIIGLFAFFIINEHPFIHLFITCVLIWLFILMVSKIFWYNKKKGVKMTIKDGVLTLSIFALLIYTFVFV
ncbi:hypothetical protein [Alkalihalobacterium chitinilyticum]|uniref:DUF4181 domain-containing protein n=1 Tax=Alkalihalobacterium chitinilyticum TaxID=2980103 RepID=A0ABT5VI72_9BACI|nr:hypothetical protein [Alkalihalobacterium chitinilyticum]MDE5415151.1 hypothetical protein [Alkalihalobacterium chitinilyticum]